MTRPVRRIKGVEPSYTPSASISARAQDRALPRLKLVSLGSARLLGGGPPGEPPVDLGDEPPRTCDPDAGLLSRDSDEAVIAFRAVLEAVAQQREQIRWQLTTLDELRVECRSEEHTSEL